MKKFLVLTLFLLFGIAINGFSQTVYSSAKGEKYHTADCKYSGEAGELKLSDAKKANKKPCEVCKPDEISKAKLEQCGGKVKDGSRCKRMTGNKNKKCFQHQA